MTRTVVFVLYPGFVALDAVGPHDVFALAAAWTRERTGVAAYAPVLAALTTGPVASASGLAVTADQVLADVEPVHTLVVPGGRMQTAAPLEPTLVAEVAAAAASATRVAGVCTGVFTLAQAGLLRGRRATTHWEYAAELARRFPQTEVDADAIYVSDGAVWTSAGVTAGIDLALALVERDCGVALARDIARELVVFLQRPGGQSQYSSYLRSPLSQDDRIGDVQRWIADHLDQDLRVDALARRAGMSPRNFARLFRAATGDTPARFVQACRVEAARRALMTSDAGVDELGRRFGFGTAEGMRRAFHRALGVSPTHFRQRFKG